MTKLDRPTTTSVAAARRGGAAYTIAEECERLFCETLRTVFLVEGNTSVKDSLAMGLQNTSGQSSDHYDGEIDLDGRNSSGIIGGDDLHAVLSGGRQAVLAPDGYMESRGLVHSWFEVWDYVGGGRFRGFVAESGVERAMFVFFDPEAVVDDLKPGLMAILELCSIPAFTCSQLVVCLDRSTPVKEREALTHDLGWVGFEPTTLADWTKSDEIISNRWIFLGMEL